MGYSTNCSYPLQTLDIEHLGQKFPGLYSKQETVNRVVFLIHFKLASKTYQIQSYDLAKVVDFDVI